MAGRNSSSESRSLSRGKFTLTPNYPVFFTVRGSPPSAKVSPKHKHAFSVCTKKRILTRMWWSTFAPLKSRGCLQYCLCPDMSRQTQALQGASCDIKGRRQPRPFRIQPTQTTGLFNHSPAGGNRGHIYKSTLRCFCIFGFVETKAT